MLPGLVGPNSSPPEMGVVDILDNWPTHQPVPSYFSTFQLSEAPGWRDQAYRWLSNQPVELAVDDSGMTLRGASGTSITISWKPELADFIPPTRSSGRVGGPVLLILPGLDPFEVPVAALASIHRWLPAPATWREPSNRDRIGSAAESPLRFDVEANDLQFRRKSRDRPVGFFLIGALALIAGPLIIFRIFATVGDVILALVAIGILGTWLLAQGVDEARFRVSHVEVSPAGVTLGTSRGSVTVEWGSPGLEIDLYDYRGHTESRFHSIPCGIRVRYCSPARHCGHIARGVRGDSFPGRGSRLHAYHAQRECSLSMV